MFKGAKTEEITESPHNWGKPVTSARLSVGAAKIQGLAAGVQIRSEGV
jgi:hypothetical protein